MLELWYVTALSIACMILLLLAGILLSRMSRHAKERRRQRVTALWQPLLEQCHDAPLDGLPSLTPPEHIVFLYLWNEQSEAKSDATTAQLNRMARHIGTDRFAKGLLRSRLLRRRILALVTLGRLRDRSVWQEISALLTHPNSFLAFQAAQALLLIDATAAIPLLVPLIGRRTDWSPLKITSMLGTAGPDLASEAIVQAARQGDPVVASRLIRHLPTTKSPRGLSALRHFLHKQPPSDDVLAACLFVFGEFRDPTDLHVIRTHLSNPAWYVRVQAATALGKLGTQDDEARLIALLNDEQWWVRYRAGEALSSLKSMTEEKLELLQATLPTPEAQEILAPMLAKFRVRHAPHSAHRPADRVALTPTSS
ncbi:MAG: HEAT repeat domain-containing protein [Nitrospira sp.]|nr:MAG: HEAT repeat domain-containing protein [Nitrospira sp.]